MAHKILQSISLKNDFLSDRFSWVFLYAHYPCQINTSFLEGCVSKIRLSEFYSGNQYDNWNNNAFITSTRGYNDASQILQRLEKEIVKDELWKIVKERLWKKDFERLCKKDCKQKIVKERFWKKDCEIKVVKERLWENGCKRKIVRE